MKQDKSRILIVDDSIIFSQGLSLLLKQFPKEVESIFTAHNYEEALAYLSSENITTLLLDLNFESKDYSGFDLAKIIKESYPGKKVIILSQQAKVENYQVLFNEIGVDGYLDKQLGIDETLGALRAVMNGEKFLDKNISSMLSLGKWLDLSKREKDVVDLLSGGLTQKEIAHDLNISRRTVETHIKNMTKKVGAKNSVELVSLYTEYRKGNRERLF